MAAVTLHRKLQIFQLCRKKHIHQSAGRDFHADCLLLSTHQDRGGARSERHDFPAVEDREEPLPDPEQTTTKKASSSDTDQTSPSSEVMVSEKSAD